MQKKVAICCILSMLHISCWQQWHMYCIEATIQGLTNKMDEWNYLHSNHCSFTLCPEAKWLGFPHSLFKCCCTYQCFIGTSLQIMLIDIRGLVHVCGNLNYFDCYRNGFCGAKHYFEKVVLSNMPWVSCRKTTLLVCTLALKAQPHMFFLSIFEKNI